MNSARIVCLDCGSIIFRLGSVWVDTGGSAVCEQLFEDCPACQDGESHPHSAEVAP